MRDGSTRRRFDSLRKTVLKWDSVDKETQIEEITHVVELEEEAEPASRAREQSSRRPAGSDRFSRSDAFGTLFCSTYDFYLISATCAPKAAPIACLAPPRMPRISYQSLVDLASLAMSQRALAFLFAIPMSTPIPPSVPI